MNQFKLLYAVAIIFATLIFIWCLGRCWTYSSYYKCRSRAVTVKSGHATQEVSPNSAVFVDGWKFFVEWCGGGRTNLNKRKRNTTHR